jgi:predicted transcriptional regulator
MATLTVRIPDDKHQRLKKLAESQGISVNKLIEELSTVALMEFDTHTRFKLMAAWGDVGEGLRILDSINN